MKKITYKNSSSPILLIVLGLCTLAGISCKKFIEVDTPKTQLTASSVFANESLVNSVLANVYTSALNYGAGGLNSVTILGARSADETDNYSTNQSVHQLANNQVVPTNSYTVSLWTSSYQCIYNCNNLIEGLRDNTAISEATRNRATGEALFFRALSHLNLLSLYGNIPLITTSDYRINTLAPQATAKQVLASVIADLIQAKALLPADYTPYGNERIRANKQAATALLARAYLYDQQWQKAIDESSLLIANTALFSLPALNEVFLKNSKEAILQLRTNSTTLNTSEGNLFILTAKPNQMALKLSFYNSFEAGDARKTSWTGKYTNSGTDYYFPYKYRVKTGTVLTEYSMVLRLAEQYLIRAEANAKLNNLPQAIADIDVIRTRAALPKIATTNPTISQADLLDRILAERRSELFTEWAHRWVDLKRNGKLASTISAIKPTWTARAAEFPIPQSEIYVNPNLTQNPGY